MKYAIIVFPGSSCDADMHHAITTGIGQEATYVFHTETSLDNFDAILLPGGFSHGDYLRPGAIASCSPIMTSVIKAANEGKPILGISNGFHILLEAGLLPGAMKRNIGLKFMCRTVKLFVDNNQTMFSAHYKRGQIIHLPVAHIEGNYDVDPETLARLEANQQILLRYHEPVNGSRADIAAIINQQGNVLGMMPHPERAIEKIFDTQDGLPLFTSILNAWKENHAAAA